MNLQSNVSLARYNTFGLAAKGRHYLRIATVEDLHGFLAEASLRSLPRLVLGGGSNVLLLDDFAGVVLHMGVEGVAVLREDADHVWVRAGAGVGWHYLVEYCLRRGYGGVENLSLIPGTVGAAPIQNIGAYGVELKDVFSSLEALELDTGRVRTFGWEDCCFGYRDSVFKGALRGRYVILNVTLRLCKRPVFKIGYGAIEQVLEQMGVQQLSVRAISDAVIQIRQSKLPDPERLGNAGSFFKNPMIAQDHYDRLCAQFPDLPGYPQPEGRVKVPAAWLIAACGWRGERRGAVGVHQDQPLVLVNHGGAIGQEICDLAEAIQQSVYKQFSIVIEPEVQFIR